MNPDAWVRLAARTSVHHHADPVPEDVADRLDRAAALLAEVDLEPTADGGLRGDRHPDAAFPHSVRISVHPTAWRLDRSWTATAIVDGEALVTLDMHEAVASGTGGPWSWTASQAASAIAAVLSAAAILVRRPGTSVADSWTWAHGVVAMLRQTQPDVFLEGSIPVVLPTPFGPGGLDAKAVGEVRRERLDAVSRTIAETMPWVPPAIGLRWSADEPVRIGLGQARFALIPVGEPDVVGDMRALNALDALRRSAEGARPPISAFPTPDSGA